MARLRRPNYGKHLDNGIQLIMVAVLPKARELNDFMDKRYGKYNGKWSNIVINYDDDDDDDDDE